MKFVYRPRRLHGLVVLLTVVALLGFVAGSATPAQAVTVGDTFFEPLDGYDTAMWHKADGWSNGSEFNAGWRADHVTFASGSMSLRLDDVPCPSGCSNKPYASGEYRTNKYYGYGKFETRMKAVRRSGVVTSFFTYTGPSDGTQWHEIDVEILGKDPTKMQTNYFTNGVGGHETVIDLGFDASLASHNYAFVWTPTSIKWYVDDVLVHTETGSRGPLPSLPGRIMVNLWPGINVDSWLGPFSYPGSPLTAQYAWIQYFKAQ